MIGFANAPLLELRRADARDALTAALTALDAALPLSVPIVVGDEERGGEPFPSTDPARPERVVALAARATAKDVDDAVRMAAAAGRRWALVPPRDRAAALRRAAGLLLADRHRLAALAVRECGKPWPEADADVAEAADHLAYAAREAELLGDGRPLLQAPGERNTLTYRPRGVVAAIGPWNFPIAIPAGLVASAVGTGNAVVLKPAEQAPACGLALVRALRAAGVPAGVVALLPGFGDVGEALVRHPGVHVVAFTGSEEVGLSIVSAAAEVPDGQVHVKRVVAEMGGKNAIIVDGDADLDEAVPDIARSAFAFAGQKCSAASRVLVHQAVADDLVRRLAGHVATLAVGRAEDWGTDVPPLIDRDARDRVAAFVDHGRRAGRLVVGDGPVPGDGWYVAPAVVTDLPSSSPLLTEEVFGPVLTVERVEGVEMALDVVEGMRHALTGGVFTRNPRVVDLVRRRSPVGNLYVNRAITGAVVGRQPFGGNRRSGLGAKVGGPDYALQFVEPQVVCEDTMRHGLVVDQ